MHPARTSPIFYILSFSLEGLRARLSRRCKLRNFYFFNMYIYRGGWRWERCTHMRWISEANTQRHFRAIKKSFFEGVKNFSTYPHNSKKMQKKLRVTKLTRNRMMFFMYELVSSFFCCFWRVNEVLDLLWVWKYLN